MNIKNISTSLKKLSWSVFAMLLVASSAMWLISKLSHRYTTEIAIPIEFTADYKADMWVKSAPKSIRFLVDGEGGTLLLYKLGIGSKIMLPVSSLLINHSHGDDEYLFTIGEESLVKALATSQNEFSVVMMTDTLPKVIVSPIEQRNLPIENRVRILCDAQYMVVGGVTIVPDSVSVKAPKAILDTMKVIYTIPLLIDNCMSSQSGAVALVIPPFMATMQDKARYEAVVERFTEKSYTLPIEIPSEDDNAFALPANVTIVVQIPLAHYFEAQPPRAHLDLNNKDKYKRINITGLPQTSKIVRQEPEFAQFYTIER